MSFVVYILECGDGSFYAGSTNDMPKRLYQHNNLKSGAHYTKIRRPVTLVYLESCKTLQEARKREYAIKQLTRKQKITLINNLKVCLVCCLN